MLIISSSILAKSVRANLSLSFSLFIQLYTCIVCTTFLVANLHHRLHTDSISLANSQEPNPSLAKAFLRQSGFTNLLTFVTS